MNETSDPIIIRGIDTVVSHAKGLLLVAFFGAAAGIALTYLMTPVFRADATLIASNETLEMGQSSQLAGIGGLAALVGGAGGAGKKEAEAIAILKSRALSYAFIRDNSLLPILFADRWNPATHEWKPSKNGSVPTLEDGYDIFDKSIRTVVENRKTGLITISMTWKDPRLAKQWADGLVNATNDLLRHQAIERSTKNLAYLQTASEKTPIMEVKASIYKLMETEIKKQMTALGSDDYAFRVVDPAVVPEHKSAPKRSIYAVVGLALGVIGWFMVIVIRGRFASLEASRARAP